MRRCTACTWSGALARVSLARLSLALLPLTACASSGGATPLSETGVVDSGAPAALVAPAPSLDVAGVEEEIAVTLAQGVPDAATVLATWRALFVGLTPGCPPITGDFSVTAPFQGCVASDGREWAGYAVYEEDRGPPLVVTLEADVTVSRPDGGELIAAGQVERSVGEDGSFDTLLVGTWGGADAADWTAERTSVSLWANGSASRVSIEGGVGLGEHAVYLRAVSWEAERCEGGEGSVRVRDPGGWWYAIALECGGCGTLVYDGAVLGEACPDLGPLLRALAETESVP